MTRLFDALASGGPALVLADAAAKATILLCLAAIVAAVLGRSAAAIRHRLWALTLCAMAVLPPLSWSLPGWRLPILPAPATRFAGEIGDIPAVRDDPADGFASVQSGPGQGHPTPGAAPGPARVVGGFDPVERRSLAVPDRGRPRPSGRAVLLWWALGFVAAGLPAVAGVVGSERRRRRSRPVSDPTWLELMDGIARRLGLRRRIDLRTSPEPLIPMTWGILRPVVLLPEQAGEWPEPVRRFVLLHELAHIRRRDVAFQLIGRMAASAYWFHPLAWYALHRMRVECEHACDDHVVHLGARRTDYARQLVDLARTLRRAGSAVAVPMTRRQTLERRIMAMFDEGRGHEPLGDRPARLLLVAAIVLMTGLAAVHPGSTAAGQQSGTNPPPATPSKAAQEKGKPTAPTAVAPTEKRPDSKTEETLPRTYTHPISLAGRAVDPAEKPVAGARVYLASLKPGYKRIAETTTDAEGRYRFGDVPLPIERADSLVQRDTGTFQVFGEAEGLGFAWRPQKWFFPRPKPANITHEPSRTDPPQLYEVGEKIELDLRFSPSRDLSGTIHDDRGNPLPDVRLEIRDCESLTVVDNMVGVSFDALNERTTVPPSIKVRTTDPEGRFRFTGLPADCLFRIDVRARDFPDRWVYAATTEAPRPTREGFSVLADGMRLTLATPLEVPIKLLTGDTGRPAPKVLVQASGVDLVSTSETTDELGRVTLKLPPGTYRMQHLPARGTPYLVTEDQLVVGAKPPAGPIVARLKPAGVVEVTVVDAETGEGIPGVDLWHQTGPGVSRELLYFRSWEVETRIAWVERPRTDARGVLRALVEPGTHRLGVGLEAFPPFYQAVDVGGQEIEAVAGETVRLKFAMRKRR